MFSKAKQMIAADRAVSPVIGVALMIGVTVLLGAVVGGFVTGLGDSLTQDAPNAQIEFNYQERTGVNNGLLYIFHGGGETLTSDNTKQLRLAGENVNNVTTDITTGAPGPQNITEDKNVLNITDGDPLFGSETIGRSHTELPGTVDDNPDFGFPSGGEVKVIWVGPEGDTTATLGEFTAPSA